ncbi:MAG: hypothetical protein COS14_03835 [Bacteroidetes bacterium CG02_land_8_20_14_3_00_31_25]|nr:hypothetical protein [Bacteroidota bacterium]OFX40267.1 MAG: hypothetical protein A2X08_05805 [Bacteroidetes bacterium GWA2_32_17]PIV61924.1 MAG: hypothetical protein COS14_03835 [Bacteroidetes bacterium CG02_land_8_20_14_3_00_31_25]PIX33220.1 MAG: hypothetical protein COZ59_09825 [Bacteroidetes bacterium CG_4_8_14_3_um_filter_31_14]
MKIKYLFLILIIIISCKKDKNLRDSIFIEDVESPGLPIYSEWGYNTFGAYYDREVFISNDKKVPLKIIVTNDTMTFNFFGQLGNTSYNNMTMKFYFTNFLPVNYEDLLQLNDTIINLNNTNKISINIYGSNVNVTLLNGYFKVDKAQLLFVDTKETEVILSGHFEFQALINNEPIAISDGRFDIGVNQSNFFSY